MKGGGGGEFLMLVVILRPRFQGPPLPIALVMNIAGIKIIMSRETTGTLIVRI
jgi:hypothetical protein